MWIIRLRNDVSYLHRPTAVEHTGSGGDIQNLLRRNYHLRKEGKIGFREEYAKVGHWASLFWPSGLLENELLHTR